MYGFTCKIIIYNVICVHTSLSVKLNNSSLTDHHSCTRYATTSLKDNSESVALSVYYDINIFIDLHVKQIFIIWFVCIYG